LKAAPDADRDLEREANVFGAELLMPGAAVREAWAVFADAAEVAARFQVPALAAQWRLYSFGLAERPV
jgi:Zn-dependent peptidase ImmA (M78 family)